MKSILVLDSDTKPPIECRVIVNDAGDHVVLVCGETSIGFDYVQGMQLAMEITSALETLHENRKNKPKEPTETVQ